MPIRKSAFKKQKPRAPYFLVRRDRRKIIKKTKKFWVKCATGIIKEIVMANNNKCFLVRHGDHR